MFTKAEVRALYIAHYISRSRALSELKRFGITDDDARTLIVYWSGQKVVGGEDIGTLWELLSEWFEG